jgi:nucleoside-diphosphate-sugar epimerase
MSAPFKKIIVIGGSGFLGSHLISAFREKNTEVFALKNQKDIAGISNENIIQGGLKAITRELIDAISPDAIFHFARPVMPRFRQFGRLLAARKAAYYNGKLLHILSKTSHRPLLVFASGSLMYGNSQQPHDETSPLQPISFARQYYKGELPIVNACSKKQYPIKVFRLPWLLGNGSWFRWFYLENILKKNAIPSFGDRQNKMEIIDVRDAVELMIEIALRDKTPAIVNIPAKEAITQEKFLNEVAGRFNTKIKNHTAIFPGKLEKAVMEAFTSNIQLKSQYPEYFRDFQYRTLAGSLQSLDTATH